MEFKKIVAMVVATFFLLSAKLYAQTGTVTGRVLDAATGEPMIGVNVIIRQHNIVGVTNIDGRFVLQNVPEGEQRLEFRMMGYSTSYATVNVISNRSNVVNVTMTYRTVQETVVKAKKITSTDASLLSIRKKAAVAQDAISAEQIAKSPDADAGDAAKRVTGVTVVDGKHGKMVYIRGLGERYANVMFAGTLLSSPDPDKKVVPLDIFPAMLLDNLIIAKSYIPEMPGEYGGGQLQVNPRDYTEEFEFKVGIGSGYHTSTTRKKFLTYKGGQFDFFGYDDGTRALPSGIRSAYLNYLNYTQAETEAIGEELTNEYTPDRTKGMFPFDINFSYNDSWRMGTYILGMVVAGLFREKSTTREIETLRVNNEFNVMKDYDVLKSTYATTNGLLFTLGLTSLAHRFRLSSFYSHQSEDATSISHGFNNDRQEPTVTGAYSTEKYYRMQFVETSMLFTQLSGEHLLEDFLDSTVSWVGAYSRATRDEPDSRTVQLIDPNTTGEYYIYRIDDVKRRFLNHVEHVVDFATNIAIPFKQWSGLTGKFKVGGAFNYRKRVSRNRIFRWENSGINVSTIHNEPLEELFTPENIVGWGQEDNTHYYLKEVSMQNDQYTGILTVIGGFGQVDVPVVSKVRVVGGVRYEYSDMDLLSFNPITLKEENLKREPLKVHNYIPGVSVVYSFMEDANLRTAYSKTLVRPDFLDVTEFKRELAVPGEVMIGNPELKQCDIHHFDVRVEWFPTPAEIVAFSVFYKYLIKPIEMLEIQGTAGTAHYQVANADYAHNMGVELEFKRSLGMIANALQGVSLLFNCAYIYSRIHVIDLPYANYTNDERPLQGQSPYVINAGISYDNEKWGFNSTLLYNIQGRRILRVGLVTNNVPNGDVYEEAVGRLDLVIRQKIFGRGSIKFSASNLLNPKIRETQERTHAITGEKRRFTLEEYRDGRNFSLSASYSF